MVPQLWKVLKAKDTKSLSPAITSSFLAGGSLWDYFGVLKHELPIILSNSFSVNLTLLTCLLLFRKP